MIESLCASSITTHLQIKVPLHSPIQLSELHHWIWGNLSWWNCNYVQHQTRLTLIKVTSSASINEAYLLSALVYKGCVAYYDHASYSHIWTMFTFVTHCYLNLLYPGNEFMCEAHTMWRYKKQWHWPKRQFLWRCPFLKSSSKLGELTFRLNPFGLPRIGLNYRYLNGEIQHMVYQILITANLGELTLI